METWKVERTQPYPIYCTGCMSLIDPCKPTVGVIDQKKIGFAFLSNRIRLSDEVQLETCTVANTNWLLK